MRTVGTMSLALALSALMGCAQPPPADAEAREAVSSSQTGGRLTNGDTVTLDLTIAKINLLDEGGAWRLEAAGVDLFYTPGQHEAESPEDGAPISVRHRFVFSDGGLEYARGRVATWGSIPEADYCRLVAVSKAQPVLPAELLLHVRRVYVHEKDDREDGASFGLEGIGPDGAKWTADCRVAQTLSLSTDPLGRIFGAFNVSAAEPR